MKLYTSPRLATPDENRIAELAETDRRERQYLRRTKRQAPECECRTRQTKRHPSKLILIAPINERFSSLSSGLIGSCLEYHEISGMLEGIKNLRNRGDSYNPIPGQFVQTPEIHAEPLYELEIVEQTGVPNLV
ncbi:hypothetical protein T265_15702, partial [Opisthorchis viverrini]